MAMNRIQFQHNISMAEFLKVFLTDDFCGAALKIARCPDVFRSPVSGSAAHRVLHPDGALA
jgi:hypothetical protein